MNYIFRCGLCAIEHKESVDEDIYIKLIRVSGKSIKEFGRISLPCGPHKNKIKFGSLWPQGKKDVIKKRIDQCFSEWKKHIKGDYFKND